MSGPATTPRQLVILSGKGGTGKTTVAAALATLIPHKVMGDCDVDAADLHLLLDPQPRRVETFISGKEARIVPGRCAACGSCAQYCRFDAVRMDPGPEGRTVFTVDPLACEGCGLCAHVCTAGAIELIEAERGTWSVSETRHGLLVDARLNSGGENSGRLVTLVREEAHTLAEQAGDPLVLLDGPPGIGCPVIASVTGADLVLLVTEPTVSGSHDLERVAALVKGFGSPLAVCINKTDLNPDMTERICAYARREGFPVVGLLPYDTAVVQAQVERKSIVEYGGSPVAEAIVEMWDTIQSILEKVEDEDGVFAPSGE